MRLLGTLALVLIGVSMASAKTFWAPVIINNEAIVVDGRHLLRSTLDGQELPNDRFCAPDENDQCQWDLYGLYLVNTLIFRLVCAGLCLFVIWPCFLCCRYCGCNLCGGRVVSEGWFHGGERITEAHYQKEHIYLFKAFAAGIAFIIFICFIVGYTGNGQISRGIREFVDALADFATDIAQRGKDINDALTSLDPSLDLGDALDQVDEVDALVTEYKAIVAKYDGYRKAVINVSLIIPFFTVIGGVGLGLFNIAGMSVILAMFLVISMSFLFVSTAFHRTAAILFGDLCVEIDSILNGDANAGAANELIQTLVNCAKNGQSPFQGFLDAAQQGLDDAVNTVCSAADTLCYGVTTVGSSADSTSSGGCRDECDEDNIEDMPNRPVGGGTSIAECADGQGVCSGSSSSAQNLRDNAQAVVDGVEDAVEYKRIIEEDIIPLLNCDLVGELLDRLNEAVCGTMLRGFKNVSRGSGAFLFFASIAVVVLIMGRKRFISSDDELVYEVDGDTMMDRLRTGSVSGSKLKNKNAVAGAPDLSRPSDTVGAVNEKSFDSDSDSGDAPPSYADIDDGDDSSSSVMDEKPQY